MRELNNKLIAEFMGANPFRESVNEDVLSYEMYGVLECIEDGISEKHFFLPEEMRFHTSWDWLMPVVSKILTNENYIDITQRENIMDSLPYGMIKDTYAAVVEFIKWYNNQSK